MWALRIGRLRLWLRVATGLYHLAGLAAAPEPRHLTLGDRHEPTRSGSLRASRSRRTSGRPGCGPQLIEQAMLRGVFVNALAQPRFRQKPRRVLSPMILELPSGECQRGT